MRFIVKMMTMSFPSRYSPRACRLSEGFTLSDYVPVCSELVNLFCVLYTLIIMYNQNQPYMINTFHVTSDWDGFVETYHPGQMPLCVAEAIHRAQVSKTLDEPVTTDYPIRPEPLDD